MLQIRLLLVAVQFYSRLPVTGRLAQWLGHDPAQLAPATRYFPVVGLIVASLTAIVYAGCGLVLPHSVALMIAMAAGLMLTGAFHEDGLADYCDAMGGHHDKARLLEIMRDSRIGTYGAAALVMMLIGRFQTLAAIDPSWIGILLVTSASLSRGCAVAVMATLPYAHEGAAEVAAHHQQVVCMGIGQGFERACVFHGLAMVVDGAGPHHHDEPVVLPVQHAREGSAAALHQRLGGVGGGQPFL